MTQKEIKILELLLDNDFAVTFNSHHDVDIEDQNGSMDTATGNNLSQAAQDFIAGNERAMFFRELEGLLK